MNRTTVNDIAKITNLHPNTVRNWANRGLIEAKKDFRGWRFFPEPLKTVQRIQGLLNGEIQMSNHKT